MATPARESTAVAVRDDRKEREQKLAQNATTVMKTEAARNTITPLLPEGVSYERVCREAYFALSDNGDLAQCEPMSFVRAVAKVCAWGLTIGETAHLVPYGRKVQAQQDYKGKIELIVWSGAARYLDAQCVYENERFDMRQGTAPYIEHTPILSPESRGKMIGAYAVAKLRHGDLKILFMSVEEIEHIRQTYSKTHKKGPLPPWYAKKTCVHQIAKTLPKSARLAKVLRTLEEDETEDEGAPTARTLPRDTGTPLPALGTKGAAGQAFAGYEGAEIATDRITTRPVDEDVYDDRDLVEDEEDGR